MDEPEIEVVNNSSDIREIGEVLQKFLKNNENVFTFPELSLGNRRVLLWSAIFQRLQDLAYSSIHAMCLSALRILSRDKSDLESLICERWVTVIIERAGLYNFVSFEQESVVPTEMLAKEVTVEAVKCLCNIAFNSEVARALCAHTSLAQGLVARIRVYKDIPFKDDVMLFDMKLLFILTALRPDIKAKIKDELHGMDYLISCLNELLVEAMVLEENLGATACGGLVEGDHHYLFNDNQYAIACEILKTQYNLVFRPGPEESVDETEEALFLKLTSVLISLLSVKASSEEKTMDIFSNVANLLTSIPQVYYPYLTPEIIEGEPVTHKFQGKNMDKLQSLVNLLQYQLNQTTNTTNQMENLSPILTVMTKASRSCKAQRKYLRQVVLPPLRDVSLPPERGNTLRNQLCRLLTTPITSVRDLVAEFLFILCKEKVGRMVKYTGFGNAAGHLAQRGLLGGGRAGQYSSSSDDSDTEEYLEAQPNIDPVVGCTRPPRIDPFEGMTEEQKEYEAMKLVNLFDKMVSDGIMKPARIGPDGRPQAVDHVMELRENPPNRPQS